VSDSTVEMKAHTATVTFDEAKATPEVIESASFARARNIATARLV
jgi:hypothetical protein